MRRGRRAQTFWRSRKRFCAFRFFSCTAASRSSCGRPVAARLRPRPAAASASSAGGTSAGAFACTQPRSIDSEGGPSDGCRRAVRCLDTLRDSRRSRATDRAAAREGAEAQNPLRKETRCVRGLSDGNIIQPVQRAVPAPGCPAAPACRHPAGSVSPCLMHFPRPRQSRQQDRGATSRRSGRTPLDSLPLKSVLSRTNVSDTSGHRPAPCFGDNLG